MRAMCTLRARWPNDYVQWVMDDGRTALQIAARRHQWRPNSSWHTLCAGATMSLRSAIAYQCRVLPEIQLPIHEHFHALFIRVSEST
eukprot:740451-Amphidinium_carterae.1